MFLHADSEDSDQTGRMPKADLSPRWAHTHFVGFVMSRRIFSTYCNVDVGCVTTFQNWNSV